MNKVAIAKEPFNAALFAELLPLAQKCWNESTTIKGETCAYYGERDFDVEPDIESYQGLADKGDLVIVTLRDKEKKLQGYVLGFLYRSLHHKKIPCGFGDTLYIEPEFRAYAAVVVDKFEKEMRALGVQIIGWPTHVNGPVYKLLEARGYIGDDIVMEKRIRSAEQCA